MNLNTWQGTIVLGFPDCGTLTWPQETTVYKIYHLVRSRDSKPRYTSYILYIIFCSLLSCHLGIQRWTRGWMWSPRKTLSEDTHRELPCWSGWFLAPFLPSRFTQMVAYGGLWVAKFCWIQGLSVDKSHRRKAMFSVLSGVDMGCDLHILLSSSCWSNPFNDICREMFLCHFKVFQSPLSLEWPCWFRSRQLEGLRSIPTQRVF